MKYCPICKDEFEDSAESCPICRQKLVDSIEELEAWGKVVVWSGRRVKDANFVAEALKNLGIPAYVRVDDDSDQEAAFVFVPREREEKALTIVEEMGITDEAEEEEAREVDGVAENGEKMIEIRAFRDPDAAYAVKAALENGGVPASLTNEHSANVLQHLGQIVEVKLHFPARYAEKAAKILTELKRENPDIFHSMEVKRKSAPLCFLYSLMGLFLVLFAVGTILSPDNSMFMFMGFIVVIVIILLATSKIKKREDSREESE